jgi:hypothetical protein
MKQVLIDSDIHNFVVDNELIGLFFSRETAVAITHGKVFSVFD